MRCDWRAGPQGGPIDDNSETEESDGCDDGRFEGKPLFGDVEGRSNPVQDQKGPESRCGQSDGGDDEKGGAGFAVRSSCRVRLRWRRGAEPMPKPDDQDKSAEDGA